MITIEQARAVIAVGEARANQIGVPVNIAVLDATVHLKAFSRMNPPVRLPLGSDTVAAIEAKHASDAAILHQWRSVSVSTDFAAPEPISA